MPGPLDPKDPSPTTAAANAAVGATLSLDDPADFERAQRGLVATHRSGRIETDGRVAWDVARHDFVRESAEPPRSVNPSLWRQARLNCIHGLFELGEGVWQARGYDLSNITFLAGDEGWVVIDPLTVEETARECLALANEHLGERPVTAVVYTHSHVDHFGGVHGVTTTDDVEAGRVRVIAPENFLHEAVSENVIAGPVMVRRALYHTGALLPAGPSGHVDTGLGKGGPVGTIGLIAPTESITETGQELVVDGIRFVFQNTPDTEAPAEMNFFFPDKRMLCMAENCTCNMHNILTPRGAQVRDTLNWSKYINEAIELFGADTETLFASHHWPRWGNADALDFLVRQRDLYRWLHDQTMRLANHGYTAEEIAEQMELPPELGVHSDSREYYGTVNHNAKAVYQRYIGWFDGNPATLHPLPPEAAAARYVEFMGGAEALLERARACFDAGEYRWVAQVVNHLVFADPDNAGARALQADALEQLGYQAESGVWRNFYLTGAQELRHGPPPAREIRRRGMVDALTVAQVFDLLGVRLRAEDVGGITVSVNWRFTDIDEDHVLGLANRALHHTPGRHDDAAAATITTTKHTLGRIIGGEVAFPDAIEAGDIVIDGDAEALLHIFGNLDVFTSGFPIVTP